MSLSTLRKITQTPQWAESKLEDQLDILSGAFISEIEKTQDEKAKERLYKDYVESRKVLASSKVQARLGDDPDAALKLGAFEVLRNTEKDLYKDDGRERIGQVGATQPLFNPAAAIRQIEAVELLSGQKFGSKQLLADLKTKGPDAVSDDTLRGIMFGGSFGWAKQQIGEQFKDVADFYEVAEDDVATDYRPWGVSKENPNGVAQIRKKPIPGSVFEVKFPDGTVKDLAFSDSETVRRDRNLKETVGNVAAELAMTPGHMISNWVSGSPYSQVTDRIDAAQRRGIEEAVPKAFSPLTTPKPKSKDIADFIGQNVQHLTAKEAGSWEKFAGSKLERDFEEVYGSSDTSLAYDLAFGRPARGVVGQMMEGVGGAIDLGRRQFDQTMAPIRDPKDSDKSVAALVSGGLKEGSRQLNRWLAPQRANASAFETSLSTISEAGSGLLADIAVSKGFGRAAKGLGALATTEASVAKAGFAASASTKVLGSTYSDAFDAQIKAGKSLQEAHELAGAEATTVALTTALLERYGAAEFFVKPAQAVALRGYARNIVTGGAIEGLAEEAPQAAAELIVRDILRGDGSINKETENLRKAFAGDAEGFKNSEILQGLVGGFGAGAGVTALQGYTKAPADGTPAAAAEAPVTLAPAATPNTAAMDNDQIQRQANVALAGEAAKRAPGVTQGQELRERLAQPIDLSVPETDAEVGQESGQTEAPAAAVEPTTEVPAAEQSDTQPTIPTTEVGDRLRKRAAERRAAEPAPTAVQEQVAGTNADEAVIAQAVAEDEKLIDEEVQAEEQAIADNDEALAFLEEEMANRVLDQQMADEQGVSPERAAEEDAANVARDQQMADEQGVSPERAAEEDAVQAAIDALRAEREAPPTINRVLESKELYTAPPSDPHLPATDENSAYRTMTKEEVKDFRENGKMRSGAARGGAPSNTVQWTKGSANLGYPTAANKGKYVAVTSAENLGGRLKPIFKREVTKVYQSDGAQWVDVTDKVKAAPDKDMSMEDRKAKNAREARKARGVKGGVKAENQVVEAFLNSPVGQFIDGYGKLISWSQVRGTEEGERSSSDWDGGRGLVRNPRIVKYIYGGSVRPNEMAQAMFEANIIKDPSLDSMWSAIGRAVKSAQVEADSALRMQADMELREALLELSSEGDIEVTPDELAKGDELIIGGREFTVKLAFPGGVVLEGDGKFARPLRVLTNEFPSLSVDAVFRGSTAAPAAPAAPTPTAPAQESEVERRRRERDALAQAQNERRQQERAAMAERAKAEAEAKAKAEAAPPLKLESVTDEQLKAEKKAAADKAKLKEKAAAPMKGEMGDTTASLFGATEGDTPLFNERRDTPKAETAPEPEPLTETDTRTKEQKTKDRLKDVEKLVVAISKGANTLTQDAVRDALVDQIRKDPDTPEAMLRTIGKRAASTGGVKRIGERRARKAGNVGTVDTGLPVVDESPTPDQAAAESDEQVDRMAQVREAMLQLSESERAVMTLELEGQSVKQIAKKLKITESNVTSLKSRAMAKLRKAIERAGTVVNETPVDPPKPWNPSLGTDQELFNKLLVKFSNEYGAAPARGLKVSPVMKNGKMTKVQRAAVELGRFFGRRVIFVSGSPLDAFTDRAVPSVIYIADDSTRAAVHLFYHELLHTLRATDPKAYAKFEKAVSVDLDAYVKAYKERKAETQDLTKEEFMADFLADRATDPEFWEKLSKTDRTLFEKIVEMLHNLFRSVQASGMGTAQWVADLKKADKAAIEALITLRLQEASREGQDGEGIRASRREGDSNTARFNELTADLYAGNPEPTAEDIAAWREANPEKWAELSEMRERVLREAGYDVKAYHGTDETFTSFNPSEAEWGKAIYLGNNRDIAERFGEVIMEVFVKPLTVKQQTYEEARNNAQFDTDTWAIKDADPEVEGDYLLVKNPEQIKSADPISPGKKVTPDQWADTGESDIRASRRPVQTAGDDNQFHDRPPSSQKALEEAVSLAFNPAETPVNAKGQRKATEFLGKLLDRNYVEGLKAQAVRNGVPPEEAALVTGVGRSAVVAYAERLAEVDPKAAERLFAKVDQTALDLVFLFDGAVNASLIGKALRSLRSFAGGSVQALYAIARMGRLEFAKDKYGDSVEDADKAIKSADLTSEEAEDLADQIAAELDPEMKKRIEEAEKAARDAWVRVLALIERFYKPRSAASDIRPSRRPDDTLGPDDAFNKFKALVEQGDASLEDIAAAFENFIPLVEADLEAAEREAVKRARTRTREATDTRETATGTTRTANQVDILAKRRIGLVNRAPKENATEMDKKRQAFKDLVSDPTLGRDEFLAAYIGLGGTPEVGAELYDANRKLLREGKTEAEKEANKKAREARKSLEEQVDSLINQVLFPAKEGKRPTSDNDTPLKAMRRHANPTNASSSESLANELRGFTDANGNRLFTEDHIATLVAAADLALLQKTKAREARAKAKAERQMAERTEAQKAEAEREADVAERRAKLQDEKISDLIDGLVSDLLNPGKREAARPTTDNDTPKKALARFKTPTMAADPNVLADELRSFKGDAGNQLLSEADIETLVAAAVVARRAAENARSAKAKAKFEQQTEVERRIQERKAQEAEERAAKADAALQERVDGFSQRLMEARKPQPPRQTSDNDTPWKLVSRVTKTSHVRVDSDVLAQMLRDFKKPDGSQLLNEAQIAQLVQAAELTRQANEAADAAEAEADYEKAKRRDAESEAKRETAKGEKMFDVRKRQAKDPSKRSIKQIILDDFINNPSRKIQTREERIAFAEEVLREKTDLPEAEIKRIALKMEGQLAKMLEEAKFKAAQPFLKSLGQKALSREQIHQAIRLGILDPSADFISSVAALAGWEGLSPEDYRKLAELQAQIDKAGVGSRVDVRNLYAQQRIIEQSVGLLPKFKDLMNSFVRANIFSAITSQIIGITVGVWETMMTGLMETLVTVGTKGKNPLDMILEVGAIIRAFGVNLPRALRESLEVLKTGTTYIDQVKQDQDRLDNKEPSSFVDPLVRTYDDAMDKMKKAIATFKESPSKRAAEILYQAIRGWIFAAGRFTFRGLYAADAAVTKLNSTAVADIFAYRETKRLGITKEQVAAVQREVARMAESHRMFLQTEAGITGNLLEIEIRDKMQGLFMQAISNLGGQGLDNILTEAASDIQDRIGTGLTSKKTWVGQANEVMSTTVNNFPFPIGGVFPAIRTNGNVIDSALWYSPIGLIRAMRYNSKSVEERQAVFPNIRSDWQFRRKQMMAVLTNGATLAIYALLMANKDEPDDEKWFWYTGPYPVGDKAEQARWERPGNNWSEYTLIVGPLRIQVNRGFGQTLYPALTLASLMADSTDGMTAKEALRNAVSLAEQIIPGYSQVQDRSRADDSTFNASKFFENQFATLIPLSGAMQAPRRVTSPGVDSRNSEAAWYQANPFWVDTTADGVVIMKNVLGEPLESETDPYAWVKKIGIPIQLRPSQERRDPTKKMISDDFYKNQYYGDKPTLEDFRDKYGDSATPLQYKAWLERRVEKFVPDYTDRRDNLLSRPEKYSSRVGDVWTRAGERAARELGLEKDRGK